MPVRFRADGRHQPSTVVRGVCACRTLQLDFGSWTAISGPAGVGLHSVARVASCRRWASGREASAIDHALRARGRVVEHGCSIGAPVFARVILVVLAGRAKGARVDELARTRAHSLRVPARYWDRDPFSMPEPSQNARTYVRAAQSGRSAVQLVRSGGSAFWSQRRAAVSSRVPYGDDDAGAVSSAGQPLCRVLRDGGQSGRSSRDGDWGDDERAVARIEDP